MVPEIRKKSLKIRNKIDTRKNRKNGAKIAPKILENCSQNPPKVDFGPSISDFLTILESFSSGKPVVAFGVGGNAELIEHKINGYVGIPFDTSDLAKGIDWVLENQNKIDFKNLTRSKAKNLCSQKVISKKYILTPLNF